MQKFSRLFLSITLHENHLEIRSGMLPFIKKTVLPYRNISAVEVTKFTKALAIHTNDGKRHTYTLGGLGKAQRCRDAIAALL